MMTVSCQNGNGQTSSTPSRKITSERLLSTIWEHKNQLYEI
ncbi:hypothetical protein F383_01086 [Gossypium arboreum]|uniref:Uncharacterized protein n=1 Tax=Gossypium arboreum TaxID=29729 RepID=A0A0B0P5C7_GOSAR|nr:hypothetical protein F383_01086 [Gossypium arboreum]